MKFSKSDYFFYQVWNEGLKLFRTSECQAAASTLHAIEQADLVDWKKLKTLHFYESRFKVDLPRLREGYEYSK